ncbi:MAG: helix-turn-helix domain-containing protein [Bacteroidota bacterium]|nr:helix-turn-helix domain-containing protein [Bacteroidota bacterium]
MEPKISNKEEYNHVMERIHTIMRKGESNTTRKEEKELRTLALLAQVYEKSIYTIPAPKTLQGLIELRMYEMRLKQKELAKKMKLSDAKLSLILSGKQKPDIAFLKAAHKELNIDANQLLEKV